jgi:uncharacterized protein with GYD domain
LIEQNFSAVGAEASHPAPTQHFPPTNRTWPRYGKLRQNDQVFDPSRVSHPEMSVEISASQTGGEPMPRYLALFKYSEAGAKGLMKEKAAAREAAGKRAYESVGGKSEALYWIPNGEYHGAEIFEVPNAATVAAISALVYSTGLFQNTA